MTNQSSKLNLISQILEIQDAALLAEIISFLEYSESEEEISENIAAEPIIPLQKQKASFIPSEQIPSLKLKAIELLISSRHVETLLSINHLFNGSSTSYPDSFIKRLEKAQQDIENGKGISHDEVMKAINQKFGF